MGCSLGLTVFADTYKGSVWAFHLAEGINNKLINEEAIIESLMCFKRAGASAVVSYFAIEIAKKLNLK